MIFMLSSVEPSSTTIISLASGVCSSNARSARDIRSPWLKFGNITDNDIACREPAAAFSDSVVVSAEFITLLHAELDAAIHSKFAAGPVLISSTVVVITTPMDGLLDRPFYFIVVLWGERFREYFLEYCAPSLLSPGNLPALSTRQ